MNNIIVLLFGLLILLLIVIYLNKKYNDKFADVPASIVYLKAPARNLIQPLEKSTSYSCDNTKCSPKEEGFTNVSVEKFTVQTDINTTLSDIEESIKNINNNMQIIYIKLIGYYNKNNLKIKNLDNNSDYNTNVTQNKYTTYTQSFNDNINEIESAITYLESILS